MHDNDGDANCMYCIWQRISNPNSLLHYLSLLKRYLHNINLLTPLPLHPRFQQPPYQPYSNTSLLLTQFILKGAATGDVVQGDVVALSTEH